MKMVVVALVGGVVLGFVTSNLLAGMVQGMVTQPGVQEFSIAGLAAFLGGIWGWMGKGIMGRPRD